MIPLTLLKEFKCQNLELLTALMRFQILKDG